MANQTYPQCPRGTWHEVVPFWLWTDTPGTPPRGVMCLFCDDCVVAFDDDTERRVEEKRRQLGRAGVASVGVVQLG